MVVRLPWGTLPDTAGADVGGPGRMWVVRRSLARVAFRGGTAGEAVQARASSREGLA